MAGLIETWDVVHHPLPIPQASFIEAGMTLQAMEKMGGHPCIAWGGRQLSPSEFHQLREADLAELERKENKPR